jgi:hypothetical protein
VMRLVIRMVMAAITMSRAVNFKSHIAILENADPFTVPHLRIPSYFYDPLAPDGGIEDAVDHAVLQAFNGQGQVLHADITGPLLHGTKKGLTGNDNLQGAISLARFDVSDYSDALQEQFHLYPLVYSHPRVMATYRAHNLFPYNSDPVTIQPLVECHQKELIDWEAAKHDDRITGPFPFISDTGDEVGDQNGDGRFGTPLGEFVQQVIYEQEGALWTGIISSPDH